MNAVEIEEAISALAEQPFDAGEFPFAFLQGFGNKETTIKRLRNGESNKSDFSGPWGLSGILCAGPVDIYWPTKRSPKMTANWTRASFHSRGARFQSAAA